MPHVHQPSLKLLISSWWILCGDTWLHGINLHFLSDYPLYGELDSVGDTHMDSESPRGEREGIVAQSDGKSLVRSRLPRPSLSATNQSPLCLTMTDLQVGPLSLVGSRSSCNQATFHILYSAR